jgi:hypothetical protein
MATNNGSHRAGSTLRLADHLLKRQGVKSRKQFAAAALQQQPRLRYALDPAPLDEQLRRLQTKAVSNG